MRNENRYFYIISPRCCDNMKQNNHASKRGDSRTVAGDMRSFVIENASEGNHLKILIGEHENRKVFELVKKQ